jgi:hypothetical protein
LSLRKQLLACSPTALPPRSEFQRGCPRPVMIRLDRLLLWGGCPHGAVTTKCQAQLPSMRRPWRCRKGRLGPQQASLRLQSSLDSGFLCESEAISTPGPLCVHRASALQGRWDLPWAPPTCLAFSIRNSAQCPNSNLERSTPGNGYPMCGHHCVPGLSTPGDHGN